MLEKWLEAIGDKNRLLDMLRASGLDFPAEAAEGVSSSELLYLSLRGNRELAHIHSFASKKPSTLEEIAQALWGNCGADALNVTEWLIALGANAVSDAKTSAPLLPARYHFFFRGKARLSASRLSATKGIRIQTLFGVTFCWTTNPIALPVAPVFFRC